MTEPLRAAVALLKTEASQLLTDAARAEGRGYRLLAGDLRSLARRLAHTAEQLSKWTQG